ncbi:sigma-54-dependent Fis family transcriptional regulator [Herbaspirillum sp. HC18]|nr:sigma-54-dependent Fis family transcriptional regulator [Herbaspirillum sp. HC18]
MRVLPYRICLIEDDLIMGEALADRFDLEGFACDWFQTGRSALPSICSKPYDVVLSDIRLPDIDGEQLFSELTQNGTPLPPFMFITAHGAIESAVRLLRLGAEDYLTKPFDVEVLLSKLKSICERARPCAEHAPTLGISAAMRHIAEMLPRIANRAGSVLLTGESGIGKEVVARALHRLRDPKNERPFVAVNCGALTETLLEAELFGYEKGAFTGAAKTKMGFFEQANGGTLFLDEIGDMPFPMQVRLLRAIQERKIIRVGGEEEIPVDIKLTCATHQNLLHMVENGAFREDLYYRVNVIHIPIPPLRERKEDILWLAQSFLDSMTEPGSPRRTLHPLAEQALLDYSWPGNVRELRNCIERASIISHHPVLTPASLFESAIHFDNTVDVHKNTLYEYLHSCEKRYIELALQSNDGKIGETAASLGISRKSLWEKMHKLGISEQKKVLGKST